MRPLLIAVLVVVTGPPEGWGQSYSLRFSGTRDRMVWTPTFPGWRFSTPVTLAAAGDTTAQLSMNASASLTSQLDRRGHVWQESAGIRTSVTYPILGPRASIGVNASMRSRNAGLQRQRTRSQSFGFRFGYQPLAGSEGVFRNLRFNVVPGVISARRASPVNPDSLIEESGLQYTGSMNTSPAFEVGGRKLTTNLSLSKTDNTLEINKSRSESLRMSAGYTLPGDVRTGFSLGESRSQAGVSRPVFDGSKASVAAELAERRNTSLSSSLSFKLLGFDMRGNQSWSKGLNTNTANAEEDVGNRFYARDRKNEKWDLSGNASGRLSETLVGSLKLGWSTNDERRLPVTLSSGASFRDPTDDRENQNLDLGGSLNWQLDKEHTINLSASTRMNRSDNPGAPHQDRDLFNRNLSLSLRGARPSGLRYNSSLSSNLSRRVNLDASRAAANQRNLNIRLSMGTNYERHELQVSHTFQISARRTIFDFDRQLSPDAVDRRSEIHRSWGMTHKVQRSLLNSLSLSTSYSYKADDSGTLLTEEDAQIVEGENSDHSANFNMSYRPAEGASISMSYSVRLRRQWRVLYGRDEVERDRVARHPHETLRLNLNYQPAGQTGLTSSFSRSRQRSGTFDRMNLKLTRSF